MRIEEIPFIAILRGVRPEEVEAIGTALVDAGIRAIEVPLNSPSPIESIALLARRFGAAALVGAGTVLDLASVAAVADAGGQLIVAPNTDRTVIAAAAGRGLITLPGYLTPTEAFTAIDAGATGLKLFPAEAAGPAVLRAHRAILPPELPVYVVGGITPASVAAWHAAGATGFGLGSGLYKPGMAAKEVGERARAYLAALPS
ncbi:2-dehydro-3-deoxy-6-phosphogalactonate aldolase [Sphingomonas sp. 67-41]|uniref:2-dehydro-3-deoxy-6-phosphogalactonate aldolase n=1 Tax=Sphingomonas TaxID=13687 RepID=UPI00257D9B6A|nr:2-dehydro-3-deoxy-6-phosphogalactonate aldolase [Sphingomonas sp. 67-41]